MLRTLAEKLHPAHCAILIVDVQNDFCAEGGAMHREGRDVSAAQAMVPRLSRLIESARRAKVRCIWIRNVYNTGPNWYLSEVWLEHAQRRRKGAYLSIPVCEPNAWNGDFFQIKPLPDEAIVTKHRYGAFESSDLDLVLRSQGIRTVIMTGVATNVCVETTARQAFQRDYYVVFTRDCTATYDRADHEATLRNMAAYFGEVVTAAQVQACWQSEPARLRAVT